MLNTLLKKKSTPLADFRYFKEFDNHEMLIAVTDKKSGLRAYIGIHSTRLGPASGGTRMIPYSSDAEAIKDVLNLSKAMSYKCALANLPFGGGKAVIVADEKLSRDEVLAAYARNVDKLNGLYMTGTDVGLYEEDIQKMSKHTAYILGAGNGNRGGLTTSKTAALGVMHAMKPTLNELYGGDDFKDRKIAIKGTGKLGGELARLVYTSGASVAVADTDDEALEKLLQELPGIAVVPPGEIHQLAADIYAPCALGNEFTTEVIRELQCRAIVGGANNQLPSAAAGDKLYERGILYVPDYVANAGGLIYVSDELEAGGFNKDRVLKRTQGIAETVQDIFARSKAQNTATHRIADTIAQERINK